MKLQWKPDFGMRWAALGVDFEMFGKDHQTNAPIYDKICEILGGVAPEHYVYELFLDENGEKISKSKGNGLTIDEWLTYASPESLALFMFQKPRSAKKLYFDVIPRAVDEYLQLLAAYPRQDAKGKLDNAVWHIHGGEPPAADMPLTFALLLNLVAASNADDKSVLWGFIRRHVPGVSPETHPLLDQLAGYAVRYYADFVKPRKKFRPADEVETDALRALSDALAHGPARRQRGRAADHHLRRRPRHSALSGPQRQGRHARKARRLQRLVQRHLLGVARRGEGPALRLVRGALRRA